MLASDYHPVTLSHILLPSVAFLSLMLYSCAGPIITRQPSNTYAVKNGIAELICEAKGKPALKYKWYHNGGRVQNSGRKRVLADGHLYIEKFVHKKRKSISDTGEYYCTVTDVDGQVATSRTVNISIGRKYTQYLFQNT